MNIVESKMTTLTDILLIKVLISRITCDLDSGERFH